MSYMDTKLDMGIQELSFDEIEQVDGGLIGVVIAVVAIGGLLYLGWTAAHNRAVEDGNNA